MRETLTKLFEYKAWANGEFLAAMGELEAGSPTTEIAVRTLAHTQIVDRIFTAHMQGVGHAYDSANVAEAPTLAELSQSVRASDRALIDYVPTLDEAQLAEPIDFTFTDGAPGRMTREEMLMHLIVHGGLHRGQIGWIMTLEGVEPPADGVTGYLHRAEAAARRRTPVEAPSPAPVDQAPSADPEASRLQGLTDRLSAGFADGFRLGKTVKFDLRGEGVILIEDARVSNDDRPADLTLTISIDDLRAIGQGRLSTMGAVASKRLALSDMGVAVGLQAKLKTLFAKTA